MDIKELNNAIPADLKVKIKDFLSKFNTAPVAQAAPVTQAAPVATPAPVASAPAPVQMGEGLLSDGQTVVKYNTPSLGVGSVITVVTPEGEVNAPEGEHTLQDGTKIVVAVDGGVSVVKEVEMPEAPVAPVAPMAAPAAEMQNVISQVSGFSDQLKIFASEKQDFAAKLVEQNLLIANQKAEIEALKSNVGEFIQLFASVLEIPSSNPVEAPRNKFEKTNKVINRLQKINS